MKSGIYKIQSMVSTDFYIGSALNIEERWRRHKKDLRKQKHHSIILQRAWNKYGEENFVFEIIEHCLPDELIVREQFYLDSTQPMYNISPTAGSQRGRKERKETKLKKRETALARGIKPPECTWKNKQKKVVMLNDALQIIQQFESLTAACRAIGRDHTFVSCITRAIKLKTKSYNYFWNYAQ